MSRTLRMTDQELAGLTARKAGATAKPGAKAAPPAKASNGKQKLQALGRLPKGQLNKTEERYADLLRMRVIAGEVLWWTFEGITLRLAPKTTITIDFAVMMANGELHMIDVKGSLHMLQDDAHAKTKIAADKFPFAFFYAVPRGRTGHEWDLKAV